MTTQPFAEPATSNLPTAHAPGDLADPSVELPLVAARKRDAASAKPLPPPVRFASASHRARTVRDAERARAIVLFVPATEPGRLRAAIDADMEAVLASRGALPPSVPEGAPIRVVVDDQVHRAAALPVRGICICMPRLSPLAQNGFLERDDVAAIHAWMGAALAERRLRLVVLFDEEDRDASLLAPTTLEAIVASAVSPERPKKVAERIIDDETPAPRAPVALPDLPLPSAEAPTDREPIEVAPAPAPAPAPIAQTLRPPPPAPEPEPRFEAELEVDALVEPAVPAPREPEIRGRELVRRRLEEKAREAERIADEAALRAEAERLDAERREAERLDAEREAARAAEEAERLEAERTARLVHAATWRQYAIELDAARGPKPVAAIEKLYTQRYIPLLGAMARHETDGAVEEVVMAFRSSFAESYEASFGAIKITAKRPTMVMDAPEVAQRLARLSSARMVKLILVDSMSWDLAERVNARIAVALDKRAVLVEKSVLWSALPATTPTQMHLLSKGPEGLKDIPGPVSEPEMMRGRTVHALRRERIGSREIMKLDLVEARLRSPGEGYDDRLDTIAREVADVLVKYMETLPARTLAYIFGDHGFCLTAGSNGWQSGPAAHGGASPEEVLVGGHGWLVDAVQ